MKGSYLQNEPKSLKIAFVTYSDTKGYKEARKRASFAMQKGMFYRAKGRLLQCKRAPIEKPTTNSFYIYGSPASDRRLSMLVL